MNPCGWNNFVLQKIAKSEQTKNISLWGQWIVMAVKIGDFLCSATKPVKVTNDQLNISTKHFKFQKNKAELNDCFLQQTLCDQCMFHFHGGRFWTNTQSLMFNGCPKKQSLSKIPVLHFHCKGCPNISTSCSSNKHKEDRSFGISSMCSR